MVSHTGTFDPNSFHILKFEISYWCLIYVTIFLLISNLISELLMFTSGCLKLKAKHFRFCLIWYQHKTVNTDQAWIWTLIFLPTKESSGSRGGWKVEWQYFWSEVPVCQEKRGKLPLVYQEKLGEKYVLSLHIHLVMVCSLSGLPIVNPCAFIFRSKMFLGRSKTFWLNQNFLGMGQKQNPVVKLWQHEFHMILSCDPSPEQSVL